METLDRLIEASAARDPTAVALAAPGHWPLTYGRLLRQVGDTHDALRRSGIGPNARVAVVVPNGPELATGLLCVAASAICAPLNPEYREDEFDFNLADLKASALIVQAGHGFAARGSARNRGIQIVDLIPQTDAEAGVFTLRCDDPRCAAGGGLAVGQETALMLQTSGTTARPKRVPLSHANLWSRARQRVAALELTERDRCLNMLPLYHGSGLQMVLATLASGGTVLCPPRFDAETFFAWLDAFLPTWYSAVPALQRAILSYARRHADTLGRCTLRFVKTGTGSLAPPELDEIERTFRAPVIQTYGITEAGTVCSNPMPPRPRKTGSVGLPAGSEVAVIDERGSRLPPGAIGEIVIRGPSVFRGYEDDAAATAAAFTGGWFRTGDLGALDADGFVFLKGRLKDLINRGGEKIPPEEVEGVLCAHPSVAEAAVFALPHPTLGEEVAAAVVLREGAKATEQDLRQSVALSLANFKVPCRVLVVNEIPKGPTGKVRRQELCEHFRALLETPIVDPRDPLEETLVHIWTEELGVNQMGIHDNFFSLGGDSLRVARMCARVQAETGRVLSADTVFKSPTIAELAKILQREGAATPSRSCLVPIRVGGARPPLFCLPGGTGSASDYYPLAKHLGAEQPVYGLQAEEIDRPHGVRLEDMAARYSQEIRTFLPGGPYLLCGYSFAGRLAWEVAQQLYAQGERVALLVLLDTTLYVNPALVPKRASPLQSGLAWFQLHVDVLRMLSPRDRLAYVLTRLRSRWARHARTGLPGTRAETDPRGRAPRVPHDLPPRIQELRRTLSAAGRAYQPRPYPGSLTLFLARQTWMDLRRDQRLPGPLAAGSMKIYRVRGDHRSFINEPHVRALAKKLRECIDKAIGPGARPRRIPLPTSRPQPSGDRVGIQ